jgi:hypothetical protein
VLTPSLPISTHDEINARILTIAEDQLQGFLPEPMGEIAHRSGLPIGVVIERIRGMLAAGTIRRVRQTLVANDLAPGALVAWELQHDDVDSAFDYLFQKDPFSGHVVTRSTDAATAGAQYKLWTTLKVPQGFSMEAHAHYLAEKIGAKHFRLMPAKGIFALGVGHVRRREMTPGLRAEAPAEMHEVKVQSLSAPEWRVLTSLKRDFAPAEIRENLWVPRAEEAEVSLAEFFTVAQELNQRRVIGRFSTFLEHAKTNAAGERVTRFNALFHWAVPPGQELAAGREVGRHLIMTHCYWREGGPEFRNVNIMGVIHGTDRAMVLAHKAAIDAHLQEAEIPLLYTNVFWGGRSEIKPSEIAPAAYQAWCEQEGLLYLLNPL